LLDKVLLTAYPAAYAMNEDEMRDEDDTFFWTTEALLLAPLALFWVSVVTGSETISRLLFGPVHTPFRDLLPVIILPAIALFLCMRRIRNGEPDRTRAGTFLLAACVAFSIFVACGYALVENVGHARRAALSERTL
jgi:hypothetical protein